MLKAARRTAQTYLPASLSSSSAAGLRNEKSPLVYSRLLTVGITESMTAHKLWIVFVLLTGFVYTTSLPGAFHFDDFPLMLENPLVHEHFPLSRFLDHYGGRPLTLFTFYWNHRVFGPEPLTYHLASLGLHLLSVALLSCLLWQMSRNWTLAAGASLLFALHPVQTQAVNYIWSRSVLLMTCLSLAALLLLRARPWLALACFQLAIWSRVEALVLAPFLFSREPLRWRPIFLVTLVNLAVFSASLAMYRPPNILATHPNIMQYWAAQPAVFWKYLSLMLWPSGLSIDHNLSGPSAGATLLGLLCAVALGTATWRLRRANPLAAWGGAWLLLALLPSSLIPNSDLINESRLYFPMVGFSLFASATLTSDRRSANFRWVWLVMAVWILAMLPKTLERNALWQDDVALWQDAATKHPGKLRVRYNLGVAWARQGDCGRARRQFETALALNPRDDMSYAALGYCAEVEGDLTSARRLYGIAVGHNAQNRYAREGLVRLKRDGSGGSKREPIRKLIQKDRSGKAGDRESKVL